MKPSRSKFTDRFTHEEGEIYLTGVEALLRLSLDQIRADRRAKLNTAMFVSGYRGSPLGMVDSTFQSQPKLCDEHNVVFNNGINEDLAATAVWGSQMLSAVPGNKYDGVLGMWYGKGPGVDRSGDSLKHANYTGVGRHGGVLALAGDDGGCKSSSLPQQSEAMYYHLGIPMLYPGNIQDVLDMGLHGYAMSRAMGLWTGFKIVTNVADGAGLAEVAPDRIRPVIPEMELDGQPWKPELNMGINVKPEAIEMERTLYNARLVMAREYVRANNLDRIVIPAPDAWIGILCAGKTYFDVREALNSLGLDDEALAANGIRLLKMAMVTPTDPSIIREFAEGLEEIIVVEEKREFLEIAVKDALYGRSNAPRVIGKKTEDEREFLPYQAELEAERIAPALQSRLLQKIPAEKMRDVSTRIGEIKELVEPGSMKRSPWFCSGCPHNRSTHAPEGAVVSAGIGCHTMAMWMDRQISIGTHMGAEGAQWIGMAPFTETDHIFQNIGDGTYFHSGLMALNYCVDAGVNITYKILYNDVVAMTGGQEAAGAMPVPQLARELESVGVKEIAVVSNEPDHYETGARFPDNATIYHRDKLMDVQKHLATVKGVTAIIYDQGCAAEKRRLRGKGELEDPAKHIFINERVCEGCGDCQVKSNCLSVQPVQTEFGRKTKIDQPTCNKDYSCVEGHCPSFLSVVQKDPDFKKKQVRLPAMDEPLPKPEFIVDPDNFTAHIMGIGGTGTVSVGNVIGAAAMSEGKYLTTLNQTGLAQKGGPVMTNLKISSKPIEASNHIGTGGADLYLVFDVLNGAAADNLQRCDPDRSVAVVSTGKVPTGMMIMDPKKPFPEMDGMLKSIGRVTRSKDNYYVDGQGLAMGLFRDSIATNMLMLGVAWQRGLMPISLKALEDTIANSRGAEMAMLAFKWGRMAVVDPEYVEKRVEALNRKPSDLPKPVPAEFRQMVETVPKLSDELYRLLEIRLPELLAFQNRNYAEKYLDLVRRAAEAESQRTPGRSAITEAVASYYYKLMAYKDEYEVARLHVEILEQKKLESEFGEQFDYAFYLQPPILEYFGIKRKILVGAWFVMFFKMLMKLKFLRFTAFDIFGYSESRKKERALIDEYRELIEANLGKLKPENHANVAELAALPDAIRGYDHVKFANLEDYYKRVEEVQSAVDNPTSTHQAA